MFSLQQETNSCLGETSATESIEKYPSPLGRVHIDGHSLLGRYFEFHGEYSVVGERKHMGLAWHAPNMAEPFQYSVGNKPRRSRAEILEDETENRRPHRDKKAAVFAAPPKRSSICSLFSVR